MQIKEQAEKTAEVFAAAFSNDIFGYDLFLGAQTEQALAENVHLIYQHIEDEAFYGSMIIHERGEKFFVLNTLHPLRIRYFTAANELWYFSDASDMQKDDFDHEQAAKQFAVSLMLPKPLIKSLWKQFKTNYTEEQALLYIADLSAVPYKIVEQRLKDLGETIQVSHTEDEWKQVREVYDLPLSPLDSPIYEDKFSAYEKQKQLRTMKSLNTLTIGNKLTPQKI